VSVNDRLGCFDGRDAPAFSFYQQNKLPEAIAEYRTTLAIDPNYPDALNGLAWRMVKILVVPAAPRMNLTSSTGS
jgi:tetratricopeptide repeat protein